VLSRLQRARQRPASTPATPTAQPDQPAIHPGRPSDPDGQHDPGPTQPSPARGIAGQVVANASLLIAVLGYMGWAYDDALYGYFHLSPLDIGIGIPEYILRSLALFSPVIIIAAALLITAAAIRTWEPGKTKIARRPAAALSRAPVIRRLASADAARRSRACQALLTGTGATATAAALALYRIADYIHVSTYLFLALLAGGVLLLTWPNRAKTRGRFPYALATVTAAVTAMWAASLYAHNLGTQAAQQDVRNLSARTAVTVYSTQRLAMDGPGLTVQQLPATYLYHYRYTGLRLLLMRSGTYYLLPAGWNPQQDPTYILTQADPIRIELDTQP
jgi:hypothetical protein